VTVVKPGKEFNIVATNDLKENIRASPAISGGQMFIHGVENLYCIGNETVD